MIHAKTKLFHFIPNKTLGSDAGAVSKQNYFCNFSSMPTCFDNNRLQKYCRAVLKCVMEHICV